MYRFNFTKLQYLKPCITQQVLIEIQTENGDRFRTKPKKIRNHVAKFYGDFVQFQKVYQHFCVKIIDIDVQKRLILRQKIDLKHSIIEHNERKSHIIQTTIIRVHFQTEIIINGDCNQEQTVEDFSASRRGKTYLSPKLRMLGRSRDLSSDQNINRKRNISTGWNKRVISKSFALNEKKQNCSKRTLQF